MPAAADTGHRYVDSAYAQHTEAADIEDLEPREITSLDELSHPWSAMAWTDDSTSDQKKAL
ncbi:MULTISPECIES: hypothetical protein [unclassified Streptomyces]|uniref:hypothetical protein n=1 Tax=unclassified Streptomyces TaxID=2593676 RepID=UPI0024A7CC3B|nr:MULTISPECIES: hypothetical protein [unclassified Streptomyces]